MEKFDSKNNFFTPERAFYAAVYYLIISSIILHYIGGKLVYAEITKPGSAFMIGDFGSDNNKGGKR